MSLRPEAPARSVAPLGVAALGRLARRAIRAGEPGQSADYRPPRADARRRRPAAPPTGWCRSARCCSSAGPPRRSADAEKIVADVAGTDDAESLARAAAAGRPGAPRARRRRAGRPGLGRVARGRPPRPTSPPSGPRCCAASAWRSTCAAGCDEAQATFERGAGDRRGVRTTAGPRPGRCRTWPGWPPRVGDFAAADADAGPGGPALRRAGRRRRAGLAARHDRVHPAAGRPAARGPPAGQLVPAVRRAGRRALGGRHAAGGRGVRRRRAGRPDLGRPGGAAGLPRVRRDRRRLGPRASPWSCAAWWPAAWARPAHAIDLLTDACRVRRADRAPAAARHGQHDPRASPTSTRATPAAAEADAHAVLAVIKPHDVVEAARVGPRVLLRLRPARARRRRRRPRRAGRGRRARDAAPSVLLSRRQAVAAYAPALLAAGRVDEAVEAARRAVEPAGRGRAQPVVARPWCWPGRWPPPASSPRRGPPRRCAVRAAYATQQASERARRRRRPGQRHCVRRRPSGVPCFRDGSARRPGGSRRSCPV